MRLRDALTVDWQMKVLALVLSIIMWVYVSQIKIGADSKSELGKDSKSSARRDTASLSGAVRE